MTVTKVKDLNGYRRIVEAVIQKVQYSEPNENYYIEIQGEIIAIDDSGTRGQPETFWLYVDKF